MMSLWQLPVKTEMTPVPSQVFHTKATTWYLGTLNQWEKLEHFMKKLVKYNIDILDFCEMRSSSNGKIKKKGTAIIY